MRDWEALPVGFAIQSRGVTLTETHLVLWSGLTGDWYPIHTDETYARMSRFGQRLAHGPLTFALAVGLIGQTGALGTEVEAWLGASNVRALAPVFIGDTIDVIATVIENRVRARDAESRVVVLDYAVSSQDAVVVMTFSYALLFSA